MRAAASVMGLVEAAPATHENVMASINNQYRRTIFCDPNEGLDRRREGTSPPRDLDSPEFIRKPIVPGSKARCAGVCSSGGNPIRLSLIKRFGSFRSLVYALTCDTVPNFTVIAEPGGFAADYTLRC